MDLKAVGRRIQNARKKHGLTQEQLAELVDLSPTHLSVIERGIKPTKITNFVAIANALEVSSDELLIDVLEYSTEKVNVRWIEKEIEQYPPQRRALALKLLRAIMEELKTE